MTVVVVDVAGLNGANSHRDGGCPLFDMRGIEVPAPNRTAGGNGYRYILLYIHIPLYILNYIYIFRCINVDISH